MDAPDRTVDLDSAEKRPTAGLATVAAEHLDLAAVAEKLRRRLPDEVP
jgi:hypothetical protein